MKCPNCGAEIENTNFCAFCGSQITAEMRREQEQLNKKGCPQCGSTNISFRRENQGEVSGKNAKKIIHRTVGVCKDCGATWFADQEVKKRKTWLWVLGWIFIFPVPLTILLLRKKDMNKILKYAVIVIAWIIYLAIGLSGCGIDTETKTAANSDNNDTVILSPAEEESEELETTTEAFTEEPTTEEPTTEAPTTAEQTTVKPTTTAPSTTAKPSITAAPSTTAKPSTTAAPQTQPPVEDKYDLLPGQTLDMTVYRTKSGKCYHYENPCGNGEYVPVSLKEALDEGLDPCEKCVLH